MIPVTTTAFDLPEHLVAKADPALIAGDEQHLAAVAESLEQQIADLSERLDAQRKVPGGTGRKAMDRDLEIHRLTANLRLLRRFGLDLCLGRLVYTDGSEPVYIGRLGLTDSAGRRLLIDWRTPAAEPFFAATHANPMGLTSRRRYRWTRGRISDYWDEVFTADGLDGNAALDDQSAFIASLGSSRSPRMRDVLSTIQADQDAIIRASSRGALVVDGGPGTGRPSSLCTALPISSTPTLASATDAVACCSSVHTVRTWPTSPTCSRTSARRACRSAPCGISLPREPRQRTRPTRTWPA